jgi:hypothetical protein
MSVQTVKTVKGEISYDQHRNVNLVEMYEAWGSSDPNKHPAKWLSDRGIQNTTYASLSVALMYAKSLSGMLEAHLRSELSDASFEKRNASAEKVDKNLRDCSRSGRNVFCDALKRSGINCDEEVKSITNLMYEAVLGDKISNLYRAYSAKHSLRDVLPKNEILAVMMAEASASVQIERACIDGGIPNVRQIVRESAKEVALMLERQACKRVG